MPRLDSEETHERDLKCHVTQLGMGNEGSSLTNYSSLQGMWGSLPWAEVPRPNQQGFQALLGPGKGCEEMSFRGRDGPSPETGP